MNRIRNIDRFQWHKYVWSAQRERNEFRCAPDTQNSKPEYIQTGWEANKKEKEKLEHVWTKWEANGKEGTNGEFNGKVRRQYRCKRNDPFY